MEKEILNRYFIPPLVNIVLDYASLWKDRFANCILEILFVTSNIESSRRFTTPPNIDDHLYQIKHYGCSLNSTTYSEIRLGSWYQVTKTVTRKGGWGYVNIISISRFCQKNNMSLVYKSPVGVRGLLEMWMLLKKKDGRDMI
jgi:hypothetical protein